MAFLREAGLEERQRFLQRSGSLGQPSDVGEVQLLEDGLEVGDFFVTGQY